MPTPHVFVLGTDTDIGKTFVSVSLMHEMQKKGYKYWKPVQSGEPTDLDTARKTLPEPTLIASLATYTKPASPDQAAVAEGLKGTTVEELTRALSGMHHPTLIEGAGGLYVPLNEFGETWLDFLSESELPILLVAKSGLGTINHTCLTVKTLQRMDLPLLGIVLNGPRHRDNMESLRKLLPGTFITSFPQFQAGTETPGWSSAAQSLAITVDIWLQKQRHRLHTDHLPKTLRDLKSKSSEELALKTQEPAKTKHKGVAWEILDEKYVWHPFTQHKTARKPLQIQEAQGVWLKLRQGGRVIDGIGSWWVNNLGHGREDMAATASRQIRKLDHVLFAGATHEPASRLAKEVIDFSGRHFQRVFFSDNGSTAVEVAIKMAFQSWVNKGDNHRRNFLTFKGGYHGDTIGAMSVGQFSGFYEPYKPMLFPCLGLDPVTSHKSTYTESPSPEVVKQRLKALESMLEEKHETIVAALIEPLVQGAGGMLMHDTDWLSGVGKLLKRYRIPLILDEVFTGLGRVGTPMAFQRAGLDPDILCCAKGLTGGVMPLALTLAKEEFFTAFYDDDKAKALLHGHSYTGNPLACALGLKSLEILRRAKLVEKSRDLEKRYLRWIREEALPLGAENPRTTGSILAFELPKTGSSDYFNAMAERFMFAALKQGLYCRPLGNTVYLCPPLIISEQELELALSALSSTLEMLH